MHYDKRCYTRNQRQWPRLWHALGLLLAIAVGQRSSAAEGAASPLALETPVEVVCRPYKDKTNQVRVGWEDANGDISDDAQPSMRHFLPVIQR